MKEQQKTSAQEALAILEEAYSYYTPEPRTFSTAPVYEDLPTAA